MTEEQACAYLREGGNTIILFHARPDGDAVGSAFALRQILTAMGMRAWCLCADEIPHRLRFLTDGLQESVLAASLPADFSVERVVSVDTASPSQFGDLSEAWCARVGLMIDHHAAGTPYAPALIAPLAAATGEIIFRLAQMLVASGNLPALSVGVAEALYAAIVSDTGGFRYSNTTAHTFRCAAALLEAGVDPAGVSHALFECKSPEQLRTEHLGYECLRFFAGGRIAVVALSYAYIREHRISPEYMETLVDIGRVVDGVEIAVSVRQMTDAPTFRVSMRSSCEQSVAEVAARFGGGGHAKAAGCSVEAEDIEQAVAMIVRALGAEK